MRIIVYEHVSGGGYAGQPIPPSVLAEGFAMLRTVAADFKAAGHEVTVLLDARLSKLNPPMNVDCTVPVFYPEEPKTFLRDIAQINDAAYIIAPETGGTLQSLVALIEKTGKISLNCSSNSIQKVADKAVLYETLRKNRLSIPKSLLLNVTDDIAEIKRAIRRKFVYPAVFKPIDGVSCGGLSIVRNDTQIEKALAKIIDQSTCKCFIVQEFIEGEAASVSLLVAEGKTLPISLNKQNIRLAPPNQFSSYEGGVVPFDYPQKKEAFQIAEKVVGCFPGLRGYVGVDFILAEKQPFVVDVNPRLTTSYIGVNKTVNFNIAQAIIDAVLKHDLPVQNQISGFAFFSKIETIKPTTSVFHESAEMKEVVSPPFILDNSNKAISLVTGEGRLFRESRLAIRRS